MQKSLYVVPKPNQQGAAAKDSPSLGLTDAFSADI